VRGLADHAGLGRHLPTLFAAAAGLGAVGLAVSGGADSLALMLLAHEWARSAPSAPRLFVYTVDHGLRPEAEGETAFVMHEATRLGLAARTLKWIGTKPSVGLQEAARQARYRLIGDAMRADGIHLLLTAHHRDDQAETVLMRLAHGSGLEGLRGMTPIAEVEGVRVFRPLLGVGSDDLRAIVAAAGLTPVADPSNVDHHYERVRWRQALPPLAALGLDSGQLAQFARRAGEADAALAQWAERAFGELVVVDALGAARLDRRTLLALPRAVGLKVLGRAIALAGGGQRPRALGAIERLHDRLAAEPAFAGATLLGTALRQRGETLWISREPGRSSAAPTMIGASQTLLWDRRFTIANGAGNGPISVRMARELSRAQAERLLGRVLIAPAAAIKAAPLITNGDGQVIALGGYRLDEAVSIGVIGAPTLTSAGNVTAN
jgi:tRNA(Ile)-lysidine synthase